MSRISNTGFKLADIFFCVVAVLKKMAAERISAPSQQKYFFFISRTRKLKHDFSKNIAFHFVYIVQLKILSFTDVVYTAFTACRIDSKKNTYSHVFGISRIFSLEKENTIL
jgi:hypothetical protein